MPAWSWSVSRKRALAAVVLIVALWTAEVPLRVAVPVVALACYQTAVGAAWMRRLDRASHSPSIYVAFAVGSMLVVLADQMMIALRLPRIGWLLPAALMIGLRPVWDRVHDVELRELHVVVALSCLALGLEWYWSLLPAATILLGVAMWRRGRSRYRLIVGLVSALAACAAITVEVARRPPLWWLEHIPDYYLYENWSQYTSRFGSLGVGADGFGFSYHWHAYAWTGLFQRLVGGDSFVITTRAAPLLSGTAILGLVVHQAKALGVRQMALLGAVGVACYSTVDLWYGNSIILFRLETLNSVVTAVWMLASICLVVEVLRRDYAPALLPAAALALFTLTAKSAFGVLTVVGFIAGTGLAALRWRRWRYAGSAILVSAGGALIASRLYVDRELPKYWRVALGSFAFLWQTQMEKLQFTRTELGWMALQWILAALLPVGVAGVLLLGALRDRWLTGLYAVITSAAIAGLCGVTLFLGNQIYFAYGLLLLASPVLCAAVARVVSNDAVRTRPHTVLALVIGSAVSLMWRHLPHPPGATRGEIRTRDLPMSLVVAATLLAFLVGFIGRSDRDVPRRALGLALLAGMSFSVTTFLQEYVRERPRAYDRWSREADGKRLATELGPDEAELVASLNDRVPDDGVVALAPFVPACPSDPWGAGLPLPACADNWPIRSTVDLAVLHSKIHKRLLLRTFHPLAFASHEPLARRFAELEADRLLMLGLRDGVSAGEVKSLRSRGVTHVVVLRDTPLPESMEGVAILFENRAYRVVALEDGERA